MRGPRDLTNQAPSEPTHLETGDLLPKVHRPQNETFFVQKRRVFKKRLKGGLFCMGNEQKSPIAIQKRTIFGVLADTGSTGRGGVPGVNIP